MGLAVIGLAVAVLVLFARDPGPPPADVAVAYELAWDRLDFATLWELSAPELRDGLARREYIAAKAAAYAGRFELGHLVDAVGVEDVQVGASHSKVRTRVALRNGTVLCNEVHLGRRAQAWVVRGYELVSGPSQPV